MLSSFIKQFILVQSVCATCTGGAKDDKACQASAPRNLETLKPQASTSEELNLVQHFAAKVSSQRKRNQSKLSETASAPQAVDHKDWTEKEVLAVIAKIVMVTKGAWYPELVYKDGAYECRKKRNRKRQKDQKGEGEYVDCVHWEKNENGSYVNYDYYMPIAPKLLRLGFHDCLKYTDGSGGCDGCINFKNAMRRIRVHNAMSLPDSDFTSGDNSDLVIYLDMLEKIFTDPTYPPNSDVLPESLEVSGKSRADLWALAALTAAYLGIEQNNFVCKGKDPQRGHVLEWMGLNDLCILSPTRSFKFFTGRQTCSRKLRANMAVQRTWYKPRAFEMVERIENFPSPMLNGEKLVDFMSKEFDFTPRETVAIMGAHHFGKFHAATSGFHYSWARTQETFLSVEYYRMLAMRKSYAKQLSPWRLNGGPPRTLSDTAGAPASTGWRVRARKHTVSGGPFQWSHYYRRCPDCMVENGKWQVLEDTNGGSVKFRTVHCCEECAKTDHTPIDPECFRKISQEEESLSVDVGLYLKFDMDPTSGKPTGCGKMKALNLPKWLHKPWGMTFVDASDCPLQDIKSNDGKTMHQIVEEYADEPNAWVNDFVPALEKLLSNGGVSLRESFDFTGLTCTPKDGIFKNGVSCTKSTT